MAEFKTDIEIAQESQMMPITEIAKIAGVDDKYLEQYGKYKAKVDYNILKEVDRPNGKLVLVTAINPTPAGEGKTTTTVGLADGMKKLGKNVIVALREPSLGPVFGIKGGAAGGGYAQVVPMEDINLHFTGDFHAIGAANNLLAAMIDNHIYQGNELNIDPRKITWKRCVDMNDRQLRFVMTASSDSSSTVSADVSTAHRVRMATTSQSHPRSWQSSVSQATSLTSRSASHASLSATHMARFPSRSR